MREHTHLAAMVGFVRKHVAKHFQACRPRPSPAVSEKIFDAAPATAKRLGEHLLAASGALGQSRTSLLRRAAGSMELAWSLQVRSCEPDPLGADIVHVREDRRDAANLPGRFGFPGDRVKLFDKNLVHAIIGGKDLNCGSPELRLNLALTSVHGSLPLTHNTYGLSVSLGSFSHTGSPHGRQPSPNESICRNVAFSGVWPIDSDNAISTEIQLSLMRQRHQSS